YEVGRRLAIEWIGKAVRVVCICTRQVVVVITITDNTRRKKMVAKACNGQDNDTLDSLGLKALDLMQQVVEKKLKLQELIQTGSINLAKSRYIMGNRNVSSSQLPTEETAPFFALRKVESSYLEDDGTKTPIFTLLINQPLKKTKSTNAPESQDCSEDTRPSPDPLQWFGVLVPQNLRVAQDSFQKAVDISIEIANLQSNLESLRVEFCTLKLEQMKLM
ncbi:Coiled-coil domain-containing protein 115, partial [Frankliniella fusca]